MPGPTWVLHSNVHAAVDSHPDQLITRQVQFQDAAEAMTDPAIKLVFVAD